MRFSVHLSVDDVRFLDAFAERSGLDSRSAVLGRAVQLLRTSELVAAYEAAWAEWSADGAEAVWASASGDGIL